MKMSKRTPAKVRSPYSNNSASLNISTSFSPLISDIKLEVDLNSQLETLALSHANEKHEEPLVEEDEEEINSRIWEELDEKYELRQETRSAMGSLYKSELIDLSPVFKALAKCMVSTLLFIFLPTSFLSASFFAYGFTRSKSKAVCRGCELVEASV